MDRLPVRCRSCPLRSSQNRRFATHAVAVKISDDSSILFRTCTALDGHSERITLGRRNGSPVALLPPNWADAADQPVTSGDWIDDRRLYVNLNDVERRTWRQILSGVSINAIAVGDGVSRAAIYARIQGNRLGQGGMIGKNFWVLLWWRLRRRMTAGAR